MIDPHHRAQVEMFLGRPLTDEDLRCSESLEALADDQIALVAAIRPKNRIAPMLYLKAVVPTAAHPDVMDFLDQVEEINIARQPAQDLPDRAIFEHYAGRLLTNAECVRVETVYQMSSSHRADEDAGSGGPRRRLSVSVAHRATRDDRAASLRREASRRPRVIASNSNSPRTSRRFTIRNLDKAVSNIVKISPVHRQQIEMFLGRALTDDDLRPAESLDALGDDQVALVAWIEPQNRIAPVVYLEAVVPTAAHRDVMDFLEAVQTLHSARQRLTRTHRGHVENCLERPLTEEELQPAESFEALSDAQIALAALLRSSNYIAPMYYLQAVVPTASRAETKDFMERVADVHIARQPAQELRDRAIFEQYARRPLTNAECRSIATVYDMSEAQIDLTWMLARNEVSIAFLYLSRIAPDESIETRHEYAKHLATLETLTQPK